ncbi:MAG: hypothetical protein ACKKL4_02265 [Patescibacteria group bacterium]
MPVVEIFNPALDIVLISLLFNLVAYFAYAQLYGKEFSKIASVDLRLSLAEILIIIANYAHSGVVITLGGIELSWIWWYILISIPIELGFFFAYKWYFNLSWEELSGIKK